MKSRDFVLVYTPCSAKQSKNGRDKQNITNARRIDTDGLKGTMISYSYSWPVSAPRQNIHDLFELWTGINTIIES